jgi:hypothetical protein
MTATTYAVDLGSLPGIAEAFRLAPDLAAEELVAATWSASLLLEREVKEGAPTGATSILRSSIAAYRPTVLGMTVVGEVGTPVAHALPVELGTKPHMPPVTPLIDWVEAKLGLRGDEAEGAAWAIARKIKAKGTKGAFMFKRAVEANDGQVTGLFEAALGRVLARLAGGGP